MNNIIIFNNIITIVSFIVNISFIIPFAIKIYDYFTNKRYVKKILGFNNSAVQISHATFNIEIEKGHRHDYITCEALESVENIVDLLHIINQKFYLIENNSKYNDEINIGGFLANKKVNAYFVKFFDNFKFITNCSSKNRYDKYPIDQRMIKYSSDKTGFIINDDIFLETNKNTDYAFLIKLVKTDFKNDNEKTVHIIFGGGNIGTVKASEYLLTHYKQIYKKYNRKHYFFAIEVNKIDESINYSRGIIDLTDVMFSK